MLRKFELSRQQGSIGGYSFPNKPALLYINILKEVYSFQK